MSQTGDHSEDDIALVGEYALHLLDAADRLAFEDRLENEPALRALLRDWDEGLVSLADEIDEIAPPVRVKSAIDARLFGAQTPAAPKRFTLFGFLGSRAGAFALAVVAALFMFAAPQIWKTPDGPQYVADIAAEDRTLVVNAVFDPETAEIALERTAGAANTGRSLELWVITEGATAPVSLGVMPDATIASVTVPEALRTAMIGATLAISDEPLGGSPTGAPTGDVLAAGIISAS